MANFAIFNNLLACTKIADSNFFIHIAIPFSFMKMLIKVIRNYHKRNMQDIPNNGLCAEVLEKSFHAFLQFLGLGWPTMLYKNIDYSVNT